MKDSIVLALVKADVVQPNPSTPGLYAWQTLRKQSAKVTKSNVNEGDRLCYHMTTQELHVLSLILQQPPPLTLQKPSVESFMLQQPPVELKLQHPLSYSSRTISKVSSGLLMEQRLGDLKNQEKRNRDHRFYGAKVNSQSQRCSSRHESRCCSSRPASRCCSSLWYAGLAG